MASLQFPVSPRDGAVLGSEYCSGYIDVLGKWNTGFYCPTSDESGDVFCCGSPSHKYCCTRRDQVLQQEMEGLTVAIGITVGAATALLLLAIVCCVCCPWCPLNRRKQEGHKVPGHPGPVYRLQGQHESGQSGGTQSCSLSGGLASLPSQGGESPHHHQPPQRTMSHSHTLPHSLSHHHSFRQQMVHQEEQYCTRQYGTLGRAPAKEQPPPYHILPRASYLLIPQDTPDLLSESRIQADTVLHSLSQSMGRVDREEGEEDEEDLYQATKF